MATVNVSQFQSQYVNKRPIGATQYFMSELNKPQMLRTNKKVGRVLVLFTGGTIGMKEGIHTRGLVPIRNYFESYIRSIPYMHDKEYVENNLSCSDRKKFLVLPDEKDRGRVMYHIHEYPELLDSSNIGMDAWVRISLDIQKHYEEYDGFVILHGTDTLAYTASALSFMFENLGKTVILTGSQIPVFESRSDGRDNILGALVLAGNYVIPEVLVFFRNSLFRGNRTMKLSTDALFAFNSPNMTPIATIGTNIDLNKRLIFRPTTIEKFQVHPNINQNVGLLRLFPNITSQAVRAFFQAPIEGVVLQTYGAGNMPSNRDDLLEVLKSATERGIIIVNCTQCIEGSVSAVYETGMVLQEAGVTSGLDMTPEAALTKLSYVLSKEEWDLETKRQMMMTNLRGELTPPDDEESKRVFDLNSFENISKETQKKLESILIPACIMYDVTQCNLHELEELKKVSADFSAENGESRTPLHVACCEGNVEVVEFLLKCGASVHMKDRARLDLLFESANISHSSRWNQFLSVLSSSVLQKSAMNRYEITPLMDAIFFDNHDVIKLMVKCGAHLSSTKHSQLGEQLCSAAAKGKLIRLQSYQFAGADLSQTDFNGNTALHIAALHGNKYIITYLLDMKVQKDVKNMMGDTPADIAKRMNHQDLVSLLT